MTATFAHSDHVLSSYAGKPVGNESTLVTDAEPAYRTADDRNESQREAKATRQRDSFLTILLRVLGAPHV